MVLLVTVHCARLDIPDNLAVLMDALKLKRCMLGALIGEPTGKTVAAKSRVKFAGLFQIGLSSLTITNGRYSAERIGGAKFYAMAYAIKSAAIL